jgi:hypothetical protein
MIMHWIWHRWICCSCDLFPLWVTTVQYLCRQISTASNRRDYKPESLTSHFLFMWFLYSSIFSQLSETILVHNQDYFSFTSCPPLPFPQPRLTILCYTCPASYSGPQQWPLLAYYFLFTSYNGPEHDLSPHSLWSDFYKYHFYLGTKICVCMCIKNWP